MGSIPLVCWLLRPFGPLQSVLPAALQAHICSRQRHPDRLRGGKFGCCNVLWRSPPPRGPSVGEVDRHRSHQASKAIRLAKKRFTLYPHFLRERVSADAFAARHADFRSAATSRLRYRLIPPSVVSQKFASQLDSPKFPANGCHPERTGPQTLFRLGVVSRRIRGCTSGFMSRTLGTGH
jgi:hypothetical protein